MVALRHGDSWIYKVPGQRPKDATWEVGTYHRSHNPPSAAEGWCVLRDLRASDISLRRAKRENKPYRIRITEAIWSGTDRKTGKTRFVKGSVKDLDKTPCGGSVIVDSPEWIEVHKDNLITPVTIGGDGRILEFEDIRHLIDPWHYGGSRFRASSDRNGVTSPSESTRPVVSP